MEVYKLDRISNLSSKLNFKSEARAHLVNYCAPSKYYAQYYRLPTEAGIERLVPFRTRLLGEHGGFTINLVDTAEAVAMATTGKSLNPLLTVGIDRNVEDARRLYRFLGELTERRMTEPPDLFNQPLYPYLAGLCRWDTGTPNCRGLETIIIDGAGQVRTCWYGQPIGSVGMTFSQLTANLEDSYRRVEGERQCQDCAKRDECVKCIFPRPLSGQEYCRLKKSKDLRPGVEWIRALDMLKTRL